MQMVDQSGKQMDGAAYPAPAAGIPAQQQAVVAFTTPTHHHEGSSTGFDKWETTLMDCCGQPGGCGNCCYASCCTACLYGANVAMLKPEEACCGGNSCGACCAYWSLGGFVPLASALISCGLCVVPLTCGFLVHMGTRTSIRTKYNLPEEPCHDCLVTAFCIQCALTQEYRELHIRKQRAEQKAALEAAQRPQVIVAQMPAATYVQQPQPQYYPQPPQPAPYGAPMVVQPAPQY